MRCKVNINLIMKNDIKTKSFTVIRKYAPKNDDFWDDNTVKEFFKFCYCEVRNCNDNLSPEYLIEQFKVVIFK
mgnify:CR=1 FL=1